MKQLLTLVSILIFLSSSAQKENAALKTIIYKATIANADAKSQMGYLTELKDTALVISLKALPFGTTGLSEKAVLEYRVPDISYVKLQRKGSVGRGILYGALAGITVGVIAGFIEGDDPHVPPDQDFLGIGEAFRLTASEKAMGYGAGLGLGGGIIGGIIGAVAHKKFIISGKKENFDTMKATVLEKVYRKS